MLLVLMLVFYQRAKHRLNMVICTIVKALTLGRLVRVLLAHLVITLITQRS